MAKPKIPNQKKAILQHKQRIERYCALIQKIYDNITRKGAQLALLSGHLPGKPFSFDDYPMAKEAFSKLLERMKSDLTATIMAGTSAEWKESNLVQDLVANKVLSVYVGKDRNGNEFKRYYQTNPDALKAFQQRKIEGMNLSDRVWNLTEQLKPELEMAITSAIAPGTSAQDLSVEIKKYLNEPDLMFRRYRYKDDQGRWKYQWKRKIKDADGNVRFIDCDKNTYKNAWTGPGYYKSSSKNAKRLARTEINMAYRTAEQERWRQFDFVVGYEVKTTQNGHHVTDICDQLAGKYPKDFHFNGWHPQCMCYAIPILKTEDEFWNYDEDNPDPSENEVTDVPEQFKTWVKDNQDRITGAQERGKLPYFIRDNKEFVDKALKPYAGKDSGNLDEDNSFALNNKEMGQAIGIKEGNPMSFEEANEMRGNPCYSEDESYRVNCQTCVVANEMRRRGFDVEALPNTRGSMNEALSTRTEMIWMDEKGNIPQSTLVGSVKEIKRNLMTGKEIETYKALCNTKDELVSILEESITEDGRYHVKWIWERPRYGRFTGLKGHIITAERINGKIRYYDPQNGKIIDNLSVYTHNLDLKRGIQFLRVDNLRINSDLAGKIVTKAGSKIQTGIVSTNGITGIKGEIKADIADFLKSYSSVKTNKEKVELQLELIKNPGFIEAKKFSTKDCKVFAPENINEESLKHNHEYAKNLSIAKKMAKNGYNVYLLSNPHGIISADMILEKNGKVYYTEAKLSTGKNSLNHNFAKGGKQSDRVLVDLTGTDDTRYIYNELTKAFQKNNNLKEIKLLKGEREIKLTRHFVERNDFEKKFKKLWEQNK